MAHADRTPIFNPEDHPADTLKAFIEFTTTFEFRYEAEFPDPPRVSMDTAIERWKFANTSPTNTDPKPTLAQYDQIREDWRHKDMVAKFIGLFSSQRLIEDWQAAEPNTDLRKQELWPGFIRKLKDYYKPTDNPVLVNYQFRALRQQEEETFHAFCNRVDKESKTCSFKCESPNCNADKIAVRDQVVIGTTNLKIREEALLKSWNLTDLRKEGMKMESAMRGESEISAGSDAGVNKIGKYSYKSLKNNTQKPPKPANEGTIRRQYYQQPNKTPPKEKECFNCGKSFIGNPTLHLQMCPAKDATCPNCKRVGHFAKFCKTKIVHQVKDEDTEDEVLSVNLFRIDKAGTPSLTRPAESLKHDFKAEVVVNNSLATVIADTGARVSVCGTKQAEKWGLLEKILPSKTRLKPYNSEPIKVEGVARCAVTFGKRSTPVIWHIIRGSSEPILSGNAAVQLGMLQFNQEPETLLPIHLINKKCSPQNKNDLQDLLVEFQDIFTTEQIGKMKDYQVIFCEDKNVKPVVMPPRATQYHLEERVEEELQRMIKNDVIEEHPRTEPAPWISAAVVAHKANGRIRITMDSRKVNEAILANNLPIPKQEDIKAKMSGAEVFSKLDFSDSFWQLEIAPESRHLTVFQCNGKLYRYKRMTMGIKTAQGELNTALRRVLHNIPDAHHIHDDIIIASRNMKLHTETLRQVMTAIRSSGLTLNPSKCDFAKDSILFWGMTVSSDGVSPSPEKVEVLEHLDPPKNKEELKSFLCMMQSNADFIPNFAQISAKLRELTKDRIHFKWNKEHQTAFTTLLKAFKKDVSLRYFNPTLPIYISTDAHVTGLAATLLQGKSRESAKPVAFASRRTTPAESRYPQIDLEAMGVDFGLRRFRNYIVGAPEVITIITDHKPLLSVFNGNRSGSIRTEKIKARNQDINYKVTYEKGKFNETDYISRHAKPFNLLTPAEKDEADEINAHLFMIHTTPITDRIGLNTIAKQTKEDPTLRELKNIIQSERRWIDKNAPNDLRKFAPILDTITTTNSGILLKDDRIILPVSLQKDAIELAHQGSHVGQSGLQRRLRYHFFFHGMNEKVKNHIDQCFDCQIFTDKKTSEPLKYHTVPTRCWETVAVDLFGPLPSRKHVIVVQDLASRFPVAKLVASTSSKSVLPALGEAYDNLGNPMTQLSDNGPPFNSQAMQVFAKQRSINLQKTPPYHPSANPAETFMKPLGKTLKIATRNKVPESEAIKNLLESYRDTPHPATGIPPSAMIFRDQPQSHFHSRKLSDEEVENARTRDKMIKESRTAEINSKKYKQFSLVEEGDRVLLRNKRKSKFQPYFSPENHTVISLLYDETAVKVRRDHDGKTFIRHLDDVKIATALPPIKPQTPQQESLLERWRKAVMSGKSQQSDDNYPNMWKADDLPAVNQPPPDNNIDQLAPPLTPQGVVQPPLNVLNTPLTPRGRARGRGRPLTPQGLAEPPQNALNTPVTPRARGRGRPPGKKQHPKLELPPAPQEFPEHAMPVLDRAVRRSERNKNI